MIKDIYEDLREQYHCEHDAVEPARRTLRNGVVIVAVQCTRCGVQVRARKKAAFTTEEFEALPEFDEERSAEFSRLYSEAVGAAREAYHMSEQAAFWARYEDHLASPEWRHIRTKVLKRNGRVCEGCGEAMATEVHHKTYDRLGDEMLFDLVAVCHDCHERIHGRAF